MKDDSQVSSLVGPVTEKTGGRAAREKSMSNFRHEFEVPVCHTQVDVSGGQLDVSLKLRQDATVTHLGVISKTGLWLWVQKGRGTYLPVLGLQAATCHPIRPIFSWATETWLPVFSQISLEH